MNNREVFEWAENLLRADPNGKSHLLTVARAVLATRYSGAQAAQLAVSAACPQCNRGCAFYHFSGTETAMQVVKCNICTRVLFEAGALPTPVGGWKFLQVQATGEPFSIGIAEKGPAEEFQEPQVVHTPK